jgi:uncharacterized membrane protein
MEPAVEQNAMTTVGRLFFGVAIVAFGVQHLVHLDFVTRVVPSWPESMPARPVAACLVGSFLMAAGAAILVDVRIRIVARLLGLAILLSFLLLGLPAAAADSLFGGAWTRAGKALALSGGAFLVAGSLDRRPAVFLEMGAWFLGAFLILCGIQHFIHVRFVETLVPQWVPGTARFWTYFCGVALIAGGVGVMNHPTARAAGLLSGVMIFLWVFMVHIPRALAATDGRTNETTAVFEAIAMSGIAFLVAARTRRHSGVEYIRG